MLYCSRETVMEKQKGGKEMVEGATVAAASMTCAHFAFRCLSDL